MRSRSRYRRNATVSALATVAAGGTLEVRWTGPANERDYIAIGETTPADASTSTTSTRAPEAR